MLRSRTQLRQTATLANPVDAQLMRRSGSTFTPILDGGMVKPAEPIRLVASNMAAWGGDAEFIIKDSAGQELLRATASRQLFGDSAWIDTVAPVIQGSYTLHVAQSVYLIVHRDTLNFVVSTAAPEPPTAPPSGGIGGLLGDLKWIVIVIAVMVLASKVIPQRKA